MRAFVKQGGVLIADGKPGAYDARGRRLPTPQLADFFGPPLTGQVTERSSGRGKAIYLNMDILNYHRDRPLGKDQDVHRAIGRILDDTLGKSEFRLTDSSGRPVVGVEMHVLRNGSVRIIALQSNSHFSLPNASERPRTVVLTLPGEGYVYDIRAGRALGKQKQLTVQLDAYEPALFSTSPAAIPTVKVSGPRRLRAGETGTFSLSLVGASPAALHIFRLDLVDPSGTIVPHYSGNLLAFNGHATMSLPLSLNDRVGKWQIRTRDLLSGLTRAAIFEVSERN